MVDELNPYKAPEASIAALHAEFGRPPVYTAISLMCWAIGAFHILGAVALLFVLSTMADRVGWREAFTRLFWPNPRPSLMIATLFVTCAAYVVAGRLLWNRRGRPGLILSATAIGLSYFYFAVLRPG